MERDLNSGDFEEFLRQKADQYKIYPSEKVWKGVYKSLHTRKRWFRIGGSLLFLSTLLFINYQFPANRTTPASAVKPVQPVQVNQLPASDIPEKSNVKNFFIASSIVKNTLPSRRRQPVTDLEPLITHQNVNAPVHESTNVAASPKNKIDALKVSAENTATTAGREKERTNAEKPNRSEEAVLLSTAIHRTNVIAEEDKQTGERREINWLQEMAVIKLAPGRQKRFNLQFYFSPTVSYRKLTDGNKHGNIRNLPLASSHLGVNYFVDHKPSVGVELGSNILYSPVKKLTLKSGLQLNYSRYNIKAYKFYYEKANIALTTVGRVADTMSSYTSLRNLSGYSPEALQNQYVQVSLPVGAELKLISGKRLQLNVAGTIQPTYLIYNDTYLLSTDFINYIKEPSLVRKWNVHTSAEAFISYNVGGMRWQVGPQFRYQTLSSYNDRYPIKEYLIEYGVKFGVSKTLR